MKILIIPKIIESYKDQFEISIERDLISFVEHAFKKSTIKIAYDMKIRNNVDLIILSGGNTIIKFSSKKKDIIRNKYDNFYLKNSIKYKIPLIGICHGAQFIAFKNKSKFIKDKKHINFLHSIVTLDKKLTKNLKKVKCFHEYKIISCSKKINVIAKAQDNSIEAFLMKKKKIAGIIWHPERTKNNLKNQTNFFKKIYADINSSIR